MQFTDREKGTSRITPTGRSSQQISPVRLRREMAIRGIDQATLAREADVSPMTVSRALAGKRLNLASVLAISNAIYQHPVIDNVVALVAAEHEK